MLIVEYQERWPTDFEQIKNLLIDCLGSTNTQIEHIGSTSVRDLPAKSIIDIDIIYFDLDDFEKIKNNLAELGYFHNGDQGIKGREAFKRDKKHNRSILDTINHHLYVCHSENEELKRHLLFRDYLRQNQKARDEYAKLKIKLAEESNHDKERYSDLKEVEARKFINTCIENQKTHGK